MSEKTKNYLGWAIIIAVLISAGALWRMAGTYGKSLEPGAYRSFAVSAEGKVVGVPDVAQFTFSVINEGGKDIAVLQKDNTVRINQAVEFLKSKGLAKEDIKTEGYNLEPRYQNTYCGPIPRDGANQVCPPPSIVGYTVRATVSVKVRQDNFDALGEVLSGVIEHGANDVSQLFFTVDDPVKLENAARAEAMAKAKAKAKSIAAAGGFRLGRLLNIDEGGPGPLFEKYGRGGDVAYATAAALPAPAIEPGSQEVFVTLTLRYEID
ncbi:MAG: SIMPL domain-containing protein [Candidatus Vogelbacteria bacterium]|nr:SIMPL domain-containing protein [Candidatus Vogelbacteria bacterium]